MHSPEQHLASVLLVSPNITLEKKMQLFSWEFGYKRAKSELKKDRIAIEFIILDMFFL